jgi:hypothetical protein
MGSSASTLHHTDPRAVAQHEFDYIIVGSGKPPAHVFIFAEMRRVPSVLSVTPGER